MIDLINITKKFKKGNSEIIVLNNINQKFEKGKFYAIMGHSGSGKSTMLNIIGLLDKPTSGILIVENDNISELNESEKSTLRIDKIGYIFQECFLSESLNVYENIMLPLLIKDKISKKEKKYIVDKLISYVNLEHRIKHYPKELSGGERQRVAIARALVNNPKIILADEPTGNLDEKNEIRIFELFKKLKQSGKCVIVVSHSDLVKKYADKIYYMKNGKLSVCEDENL